MHAFMVAGRGGVDGSIAQSLAPNRPDKAPVADQIAVRDGRKYCEVQHMDVRWLSLWMLGLQIAK